MLGAITTKLCTLMYYGKLSPKQRIQICKQQQTASGNKNLILQVYKRPRAQKLVNVVYGYNFPMLGALTANPCTVMFYNCRNVSTSVQDKRKDTSK